MVESKSYHYKITPTADLISYFRTFSDTPFTKEIAKITNAKKIAKDMLKDNFEGSSFLAVMSEARYKKIDLYAKKFNNILEVAVGRSPRGLIFTENPGINYVATDLPDSLKNYKSIMEELMEKHKMKRPNLHFAAANALDYKELESAERLLPEGLVAIISEGMMIYFSKEEQKLFLENVHKILEKRGGVLITSDITIIPEHAKKSGNNLFNAVANSAGRDIREGDFKSIEDAKYFISECGFESEIFNPKIDLVSLKRLNLEGNERAQRLANNPVWILKIKD